VPNVSQNEKRVFLDQGSSSAPPSPSPSNDPEENLEVLRQRLVRVREDKEQLERIQQLKDLEAELQVRIMAAEKKADDT